jgi:hypothetical protein
MAQTEITLQVPVSIVFDDATTTAAASVEDFFRALAEAAQAGFLDRTLIDIAYGRPDQWTTAPAAGSPGPAGSQPGPAGTSGQDTAGPPGTAALTAAAAALPDGALDDLVHDVASRQASNVNNNGQGSQAAFLAAMLGPEAALAEITGLGQDDADGDPR